MFYVNYTSEKNGFTLHLSHEFSKENLPPTSEPVRNLDFTNQVQCPNLIHLSTVHVQSSVEHTAGAQQTLSDPSEGLKCVQGLTFKYISSCWG